jgi:rubrerythrin
VLGIAGSLCLGSKLAEQTYKQQTRQRRKGVKDKIRLEEAWRLAIQREQEARDFYEEMAGMVEDSALKNLFVHLIEQEKKHKQLLEEEYEKMFTPEN